MASQARYEPQSSGDFTGTLKDAAGTAIPLANIVSCTLTLTNAADGSIVNSRNAQNVLNANNVTINSTTGALRWLIQPADLTLVDSSVPVEEHIATFKWTYETNKVGFHTHRLRIVNFLMLCTTEDVRLFLQNFSDEHLPLVEFLIESFSTLAEAYTDRWFKKRPDTNSPYTEYFSGFESKYHFRVRAYPISTVVDITETVDGDFANGTVLNSDDYSVYNEEGLIKFRWRNALVGTRNLKVRYTGGLAYDVGAVPSDLRMAAARQVAFWFQRRNQIGITDTSIARSGRQRVDREGTLLLPEVKDILASYTPIWI